MLGGERKLFFKFIRSFGTIGMGSGSSINLDSILRTYENLSRIEHSEKVILFPLGVITLPAEDITTSIDIRSLILRTIDDYFPATKVEDESIIIVYDKLSTAEGWTNKKPGKDIKDAYQDR